MIILLITGLKSDSSCLKFAQKTPEKFTFLSVDSNFPATSRSEKLLQLNGVLREQLEESHSTNEMLSTDLQKLTNDFETLREEMLIKEDEWKDEEQAFNDYYR